MGVLGSPPGLRILGFRTWNVYLQLRPALPYDLCPMPDWCRMLVNLLIALQQQSEAQGYKSQAADTASKAPSAHQACASSYIPVLIGGVRLFSSLL